MPLIMPKENLRTTPYFEAKKLFSNISKSQQLLPTPRAIIGDRNLPKALSFQPILFNPSHQKRASFGKESPKMLQDRSIIPYFLDFDT
jgi:hypothetical protein